MSRRAPGRLDQARFAAQIPFLVGIEDAHQADLRQIQAFSQQIDADENVELAGAQAAQDLHALDGIDVAVHVAHLQIHAAQVIGQVFGGAFGQGGDQHALALLDPLAAEFDGFVDLAFSGRR